MTLPQVISITTDHTKRQRTLPSAPTCTKSLRDELLKLFKAGHSALSLDSLIAHLRNKPKLAEGLAEHAIVVRALAWLHEHDPNPICTFADESVRSLI